MRGPRRSPAPGPERAPVRRRPAGDRCVAGRAQPDVRPVTIEMACCSRR
jgi:hypothetical protein